MYRTILVPIDGSPAATAGLEEAIRIAATVGATLELMNVVDDMAFADEPAELAGAAKGAGGLRSVVTEQGEKVLRRGKERAEAQGVVAATALVRSGAERLHVLVGKQAESCGADLIVLGSHGRRGLSRLLMDSEAEHLLNVVTVPVLLVRSEHVGPDLSVTEITASDSMFQSLA
jgi:nucleotide-binding universal stress UspA family protein